MVRGIVVLLAFIDLGGKYLLMRLEGADGTHRDTRWGFRKFL